MHADYADDEEHNDDAKALTIAQIFSSKNRRATNGLQFGLVHQRTKFHRNPLSRFASVKWHLKQYGVSALPDTIIITDGVLWLKNLLHWVANTKQTE